MFKNTKLIYLGLSLILLLSPTLLFQNCSQGFNVIDSEINTKLLSRTNSRSATTTFSSLNASKIFEKENTVDVKVNFGVNSDSFSGDPALNNRLIGRKINDVTNYATSSWSLVLAEMNWTTMKIDEVGNLLDTKAGVPIENGKRIITTAYDPSIIQWNGELWVAFECGGSNIGATASTCIGPLTSDLTMDQDRINVIISGANDGHFIYSASVPKLVIHQGKIYLYWSMVKMGSQEPHLWESITSRGIEIALDQNHKFWVKNSNQENFAQVIDANDPHSIEVFSLGTDNRSDSVADLFQVISDGTYLYATGARGGTNGREKCVNPLSDSSGCYRLSISRTQDPLGEGAFSRVFLSESNIPQVPQEYCRFIFHDNATYLLCGNFINAHPELLAPWPSVTKQLQPPTCTAKTLFNGMCTKMFKWPDSLITPICDPTTQQWPKWGVKNNSCFKSCGQLGGTHALQTSCPSGMIDVGQAYDTLFCCKKLSKSTCSNGAKNYPTCTPPTCNSFTYIPTQACQPNGTQTISVTMSSPKGCAGGTSASSQTCTYTASISTSFSSGITAFLKTLYLKLLNRQPDPAGFKTWGDALTLHLKSPTEIVFGFVNSTEFQSKNLSNEDFVKILYDGVLGRPPDLQSLSLISKLNTGTTRTDILNSFVQSSEFSNRCSSLGLTR